MKETVGEFERMILWAPAYDRRSTDRSKDYGIHGAEVKFVTRGPLGAIQFQLYTNWHLPHVQKELDRRPVDDRFPHLMCQPFPADIGYHSPRQMHEGQMVTPDCEYIGTSCYYDGSGLAAVHPFNALVQGGEDALWKYLEDEYHRRFEDDEDAGSQMHAKAQSEIAKDE